MKIIDIYINILYNKRKTEATKMTKSELLFVLKSKLDLETLLSEALDSGAVHSYAKDLYADIITEVEMSDSYPQIMDIIICYMEYEFKAVSNRMDMHRYAWYCTQELYTIFYQKGITNNFLSEGDNKQ